MSEKKQNTITFNSSELEQMQLLIPEERFKEFFKRIEVALEIYQELDEPKLVQMELRKVGRLTKKVNYTLVNAIKNLSPTTKEFLARSSPLPPLPDIKNEEDLNQYARDIRRRVLKGSILSNKETYNLPTGAYKIGRPRKERIDVLVSFVAAAYVLTTGNTIRREWDVDNTLPMQKILMVIFNKLGLKKVSIDEAIRRLLR